MTKDVEAGDQSVTPRLRVWDDVKVADRWRFVEDQDQDVSFDLCAFRTYVTLKCEGNCIITIMFLRSLCFPFHTMYMLRGFG